MRTPEPNASVFFKKRAPPTDAFVDARGTSFLIADPDATTFLAFDAGVRAEMTGMLRIGATERRVRLATVTWAEGGTHAVVTFEALA